MRYRLMATYRGVPYEAGIGPTDKDVVLFAACPPPEELGFLPAPGHWRKPVSRAEVDAVWESRPSGMFRGEPCLVIDDLGEHLHISYLGDDSYQAEQLGYSQMEPGVFELVTTREDVTGIAEDRIDHAFPGQPEERVVPAGRPFPAERLLPDWRLLPDGRSLTDERPLTDERHLTHERAGPAGRPLPDGRPLTDWRPFPDERVSAAKQVAAERPVGGMTIPDPAALIPPQAAPPQVAPPQHVPPQVAPVPGTRRGRAGARPQRARTQETFAELVNLAAMPQHAYAVDEIVDGAICLIRTESGFEVFSASDGIRQEVRFFQDEEAAYFYLFGLLAAEAVRDGRLIPPG